MVDVLLIEGVSFTCVVRRLKFIGISLSMFSNKMPLIESFLSPIFPNMFNRSFTAAVKYTSEFVIKSSAQRFHFNKNNFIKR